MADVWIKRSDGSQQWARRRDVGSTAERIEATSWTTATRPVENLFAGRIGFNLDFGGFEHWNGSKWLITSGEWTTATRPITANIAPGSQGFNRDPGMGFETWTGTHWVQ